MEEVKCPYCYGQNIKKAGYDINKNYSENELKKTKETINKLENDRDIEKATKNELIANLKIRQLESQLKDQKVIEEFVKKLQELQHKG